MRTQSDLTKWFVSEDVGDGGVVEGEIPDTKELLS